MNRISTYTQFYGNAGGVLDGQAAMAKAQAQASSQKVATDLKGFGEDAGRLISAKSYAQRLDRRAETLTALEARAEVEATAMSTASEAVKNLRDAIGNSIANKNGAGLRSAMEQALEIVGMTANQQFAGQAVFGGDWGYGEPFVGASLDTLAAQPNTDPNWVDTGSNRTIMVEDGRAIQLSPSAEAVFRPIVDYLRDLRKWEIDNGAPFQGALTNAQLTHLQSTIPALSTVHSTMIEYEATAGTTAKQIELAIASNEARRDTLQSTIANQENVDLAEVAAQLSAAQTQYQASAAIFGQLKDMNLLQYLR
jgi:flagellar hook-associated protein 3 FlgL